MFNKRDKIIKKAGEKPTDLEDEVAKSLAKLEAANKEYKAYLSIIFINSSPPFNMTKLMVKPVSTSLSESHTDLSAPSRRSDPSSKSTLRPSMHQNQLLLLPTGPLSPHPPSIMLLR